MEEPCSQGFDIFKALLPYPLTSGLEIQNLPVQNLYGCTTFRLEMQTQELIQINAVVRVAEWLEIKGFRFFIFDSPMGDEICVEALLQRYEYWYIIYFVEVCIRNCCISGMILRFILKGGMRFERLSVYKRFIISMGRVRTQDQPILHGRKNTGCGTFWPFLGNTGYRRKAY